MKINPDDPATNDSPKQQDTERTSYMPGDDLDWNSAKIKCRLICELPFWLMTPNGKVTININGCKLNVEINNTFIEAQAGNQYSATGYKTMYLGHTGQSLDKYVRFPEKNRPFVRMRAILGVVFRLPNS